jgi:hypothetical protein
MLEVLSVHATFLRLCEERVRYSRVVNCACGMISVLGLILERFQLLATKF